MQRRKPEYTSRVSTLTAGDKTNARVRVQAHEASAPLDFYPAYTFKASRTWSKWVKLTCNDVHTVLKSHDSYSNFTTSTGPVQFERTNNHGRKDSPLLLFYLNHPVQFVQVIGVVVVLEDYLPFWLFTVDDSSGATVDVTCRKPEKDKTAAASQSISSTGANAAQQANVNADAKSTSEDQDEEATTEQLLQSTLKTLTIGTVVQAKGTLTTFRKTRQLTLLRLNILPSTAHELVLISSRSEFYTSTLTKPWNLSREEQRKLRAAAQGEKDEELEHAKRRRKREQQKWDREERHRKVIEGEYAKEEEERAGAAEEARRCGEEFAREQDDRRRKIEEARNKAEEVRMKEEDKRRKTEKARRIEEARKIEEARTEAKELDSPREKPLL